eukprot:6583433-Pyramimonas_sp.AAC.1
MQALLAMEDKKFLGWQPRLENGSHFFAVAVLKSRVISVMGRAVGQQIDAPPREFRMGRAR